MRLILIIAHIALFIYIIILYNNTKDYSILYKVDSRTISKIYVITNLICIIVAYISFKVTNFAIFIGVFIGIFILYATMKMYLRSAQTLADINWKTGSKILKSKFNFSLIEWKYILFVNIFLALWTCIIFTIKNPIVNENIVSFSPTLVNINKSIVTYIAMFILAPIMEEIMYRYLYLQIFLYWAKKITKNIYFHWGAMLIPTIIWVLYHNGVLVNYWIKYIQILPLGIICMYTAYKKDIEHSILIHSIFNIIAAILTVIFRNVWF